MISRKKKIIWFVVILLVACVGIFLFMKKRGAPTVETSLVSRHNLIQTVLTTGQVISATDVDLSFKENGFVTNIFVKEGDRVTSGQILATLDQKNARASLTTSEGSLAQAQANVQKVLAGASDEDIRVAQSAVDAAQTALDNAQESYKQTQNVQSTLVQTAYTTLLNSTLSATPAPSNSSSVIPIVSGTYTPIVGGNYSSTDLGQYHITAYGTGNGMRFTLTGIEESDGQVSTIAPVALGKRGLFLQFPNGLVTGGDSWTITIPNTKASTYLTNLNLYQSALQTQAQAVSAASSAVKTAGAQLEQARASLDLKKAQARPADIAVAQAQVLSAQGQVDAAKAVLEDSVLRAPANGTMTSVDIKIGEEASALKEVMVLQDISNVHVEANVSEADVASLKTNQSVDYTFDAFGPSRHFQGEILKINPASVVISGVVDYKVTASFDHIPNVKPGMTANMTITTGKKDNVLAVPNAALVAHDAKQFVRLVDDLKKETFHEVPVATGISADGGFVEIVSGLSEGVRIVTY